MSDDRRTCLDLFAGLGGFSAAFADSEDWRVVTVDIEERFDPDIQADVMDLRPSDLPDADVVLASPPCTMFSRAGNHDAWNEATGEPISERAKNHVALAHHTLGLIKAIAPTFWFLENPRGRMRWVIGEPVATVTYCQYGREYMKPTDLWGKHPDGMDYLACVPHDDCHMSNETGGVNNQAKDHVYPNDKAERSKVPYELSEAILEAVEGRAEQKTLTEATHD